MRTLAYAGIGITLLLFALGLGLMLTAKYFDGHVLSEAPAPKSVVIDNVHLLPMSSPLVRLDRKVVIEKGRISAIEPAGPPYPDGIEVMDLGGAYLIPGLVDMHVHIDDREQLRLALSYGVTAVRNMDGMPFHLRWKKELERGDWLGSRLYSASPSLHGPKSFWFVDLILRDEDEAQRALDRLSEEGWDFLKVYSGLGLSEFSVLVGEANRSNLPVVGHIPYEAVRADYSLSGRMATIEHAEEIFQGPMDHNFDDELLSASVEVLSLNAAVVCPTLATFENLTLLSTKREQYLRQLPTSHMTRFGEFFQRKIDVERWLNVSEERADYNLRELQYLKEIVGKLHQKGVTMVLGTDAGTNFVQPGPSLIQEIRLMRESGLDAYSILESATLNAAKALKSDQNYGSIEVGKLADFVVTESNPIENMSSLEAPIGVVVYGNLLGKKELIELRSGESRVAGWWVSVARYFETVWVRRWEY